MTEAAYDRIGRGYSKTRRSDPRIASRIQRALGAAETVLNVGAGTGSYEPTDRTVTAVEPSAEMIAQRPRGSAPVVQAAAERLPFADGSFEAAMALLSIHHWEDPQRGIAEMQRVARRSVVLTFDAGDLQNWWLRDYAPQIAADDSGRFPPIDSIVAWMGGARVEVVEVSADCADLFLGALFARPELILDDGVRTATSGFARMEDSAEGKAVDRLRSDLENGRWDRLYGHYRELELLDVGLRLLITAAPEI
jgi:SAM-dependent methyltransferase